MTELVVLTYGIPVVLAAIGLIAANSPPQTRRGRVMFDMAIVALAVTCVAAAVVDAKMSERRLAEMLTGGDNYGYLSAEVESAKNTTDPVPLWIKATGLLYGVSYWIAPANVTDPNNPAYWSIGGGHIRETRGGIRVGRSLPPGKYRVEITARNGSFFQILEIKSVGGKLVQTIDVYRPGKGRIFTNRN